MTSPRVPARIHTVFVPTEWPDTYAVEDRTWRTATTVGRVVRYQKGSWMGLGVGSRNWSPAYRTTRAAAVADIRREAATRAAR